MTPTEAALRAIEVAEDVYSQAAHWYRVKCGEWVESELAEVKAALAAPPHGKDAGEEPETAALKPESEWDVPYVLRLAEQRDALHARLTEAEGLLRAFCAAWESGHTRVVVGADAFVRVAVGAALFLKPPEGTP